MEAALAPLAARQARVVAALVLREMRARFGRTQIGYLWAIGRPVLFISGLSYIFVAIGRPPPFGNSMPLFFATGMLPFYVFSRTMRNMTTTLDQNESLFEYPIVKPLDSLLSRGILEVVTYSTAMIICLSGMMVILGTPAPDRIEVLVLAVFGLGLLGFGMGCINAVIGNLMPSWRLFLSLWQRPLIFFSAVLHPLEGMPQYIRDWLAWNPIAHGVELFRSGYYMQYRSSVLDPVFLFGTGLVLCLIGLAAERALRLRIG